MELNPQDNPDNAEELEALRRIEESLKALFGSSASATFASSFITDSSLKYLWGLINTSQLMALVPLIDVPLPPNVMIIFQFMSVANGDFDFLQSLPNLFREKAVFNFTVLQEQKALNENFAFTGYESGSFFLL